MYNAITENGQNVLINAGLPNFATPASEGQGQRGYNTIAHASAPLIKVQNNSSTYMGYSAGGGYNSIYDTDLPQIYATNTSIVYADNNYWGEEGPANAADGTSSVWDRYPLSGNPNPKIDSNDLFAASTNSRLTKELNTPVDQEEEEFQKAIAAGFHSDYITSKALLKKIIDKNSGSKYPPLALMMFYHFTQKELQDKDADRDKNLVEKELADLLDELEQKPKENFLRPFGLKFRAQEAALARDYTTLSAYHTRIISEYPNSVHELTSLYDEIAY